MEFDQSLKPRKPKFREVSSRFLSPTSNSSSANQINAMSSPNHVLSPVKQKPRSSTDSRKHKGPEKSGFMAKLWPSSAPSSSKVDTLGNHLGHERLKELEDDKNGDRADNNPMFLNRQNSCLEFSRFEREKDKGLASSICVSAIVPWCEDWKDMIGRVLRGNTAAGADWFTLGLFNVRKLDFLIPRLNFILQGS
nr:QWRF motif-containing protein 3 [Ipomoea batatas]